MSAFRAGAPRLLLAALPAAAAGGGAFPFTEGTHLAELGPAGLRGWPDCGAGGAGDAVCAPRRSARPGQISVACVGDSITAGVGSSGDAYTYPSELQRLLGGGYAVTNYGRGGTCMQKGSDNPYWGSPQYKGAMASNADIVIIMLGTNDAKDTGDGCPPPGNWQDDGHSGSAEFQQDYKTMIDQFKAFASKPVIYIMVPPPLYKKSQYGMNQTVINKVFPGLIPKINADNGLPHPPIDIFSAMGGAGLAHPEWFNSDNCHPRDVGYVQLADAVGKVLCPNCAPLPPPAPPTPAPAPPPPPPPPGAWGPARNCTSCEKNPQLREVGQGLTLEQCRAACVGAAGCGWINFAQPPNNNGDCVLYATCDNIWHDEGNCHSATPFAPAYTWWTAYQYTPKELRG